MSWKYLTDELNSALYFLGFYNLNLFTNFSREPRTKNFVSFYLSLPVCHFAREGETDDTLRRAPLGEPQTEHSEWRNLFITEKYTLRFLGFGYRLRSK